MAIDIFPPVDVIAQPPSVGCRLERRVVQSLPTGTTSVLTFTGPTSDTDGMWNPAFPTRITIRTPGRYLLTGAFRLNNDATGVERSPWFQKNGSGAGPDLFGLQVTTPNQNGTGLTPVAVVEAAAGDYFELAIYHNATGAITTFYGSYPTVFSAHLLSGNANGVPSGAKVSRAAAYSIPAISTWSSIPWDTAETDTDALWNSSTPSRLYARKDGWYVVAASVSLSGSSTGIWRVGRLWKNNVDSLANGQGSIGSMSSRVSATAVVFLRTGDYVEFQIYQDAAATLAVEVGGTDPACEFSMVSISGTTVSTRERPAATLHGVAAQSIPNAVATYLTFDQVLKDTDGIHTAGTSQTKIRTPGRYLIVGNFELNGGATGSRQYGLIKNGGYARVVSAYPRPDGYSHTDFTAVLDLLPGDLIQIEIYQTSGAAINIGSAQASYTKSLTLTLLEPMSPAALNAPEGWHEVGNPGEPGYLNGWVRYEVANGSAGWNNAGFYKDPMGQVHLKGMVKNGPTSSNIFVLPVGYRPPVNVLLTGMCSAGVTRIDVYANGSVLPVPGSSAWTSLDNLHFRTGEPVF